MEECHADKNWANYYKINQKKFFFATSLNFLSFPQNILIGLVEPVQLRVEGHENWQNLHRRFDAMVKILSIFVAFLENMNSKAKLLFTLFPTKDIMVQRSVQLFAKYHT